MRLTLPLADLAVCDENGKHVDVYRIRFWENLNFLREEIMRKSMAVFVFLIAGVFLCGNACALETFIPHVTYGSPDWDDYLQANNNTSADASFTLTLYGGGRAGVFRGPHGPRPRPFAHRPEIVESRRRNRHVGIPRARTQFPCVL